MRTVVTLGEIMVRFSTPGFLRLCQSFPGTLDTRFAGAEANVAASICMFGGTARFVTSLPNNTIADACVAYLRGLGVDTSAIVRTRSGRMGSFYLETGANQRGSFVLYDRDNSSFAITPWEEYHHEAIFQDAAWVHVSGITPALSRETSSLTLDLLREAKNRGIMTSIDLNFRKKLWNWETGLSANQLARRTVLGLLPYIDVLFSNEEDTAEVLGIQAIDTDVERGIVGAQCYAEVARRIIGDFGNILFVAITLRESISASINRWGAMLFDSKRGLAFFAPSRDGLYFPYEINNIVDRVGTGDAFAGSLIYALSSPDLGDPELALRFSAAASCLCHSIVGDINYVSRHEVETVMQGVETGRVQR
jgi:2-dehydro-3-deoxygluconokinase